MHFSRMFRGRKRNDAPAPNPRAENPPAEAAPAQVFGANEIESAVIEVLRTVYDPEIPVNIYELGLVYDVIADGAGRVVVRMTLTSPGCPVAAYMIPEIESKIGQVPGVASVSVQLVWDPPWDPEKMSDAAKLQLGMY